MGQFLTQRGAKGGGARRDRGQADGKGIINGTSKADAPGDIAFPVFKPQGTGGKAIGGVGCPGGGGQINEGRIKLIDDGV